MGNEVKLVATVALSKDLLCVYILKSIYTLVAFQIVSNRHRHWPRIHVEKALSETEKTAS